RRLLVPPDDPQAPPLRTHDPRRRRRAQMQRVAQRDHPVPHLDRVRITQRRRGQPRGIYLQHRDVRVRIPADHPRLELPPVLHHDPHPVRPVHHVVVRQDVAVRPEDHPGPVPHPRRRLRLPPPEQVLPRRAPERLRNLDPRAPHRLDLHDHHRRQRPLRRPPERPAQLLRRARPPATLLAHRHPALTRRRDLARAHHRAPEDPTRHDHRHRHDRDELPSQPLHLYLRSDPWPDSLHERLSSYHPPICEHTRAPRPPSRPPPGSVCFLHPRTLRWTTRNRRHSWLS